MMGQLVDRWAQSLPDLQAAQARLQELQKHALGPPTRSLQFLCGYERFDGRAELTEFQAQFFRLDDDEFPELRTLLSSSDPRGFSRLADGATSARVRNIL